MIFGHKSVLLDETIESLDIKPDGIYVDGDMPARYAGDWEIGEGLSESIRMPTP